MGYAGLGKNYDEDDGEEYEGGYAGRRYGENGSYGKNESLSTARERHFKETYKAFRNDRLRRKNL